MTRRSRAAVDTLLVLLAPIAPHLTEELWHERRCAPERRRQHTRAFTSQPWPEYDPALIVDETVTIVVQVNGKVRDKLELAPDTAEDEVRERALASAKVQSAMEGRALKKFIYVPGGWPASWCSAIDENRAGGVTPRCPAHRLAHQAHVARHSAPRPYCCSCVCTRSVCARRLAMILRKLSLSASMRTAVTMLAPYCRPRPSAA